MGDVGRPPYRFLTGGERTGKLLGMTKNKSAEELISQKKIARDKFHEKMENSRRAVEDYKRYAEKAEEEYLKREAQVSAMEARVVSGLEARKEADELRKSVFEWIDRASPEEKKSAEYLEMREKLRELDKFYHDTAHDVAKIYNGTVQV